MMTTKYFAINFEEPCKNWLCADNLKIILQNYCKNTNFKVAEIGNVDKEIEYEIERKVW